MYRDPASLPDPFPPALRPIVWAEPGTDLVLVRFRRRVRPRNGAVEFVRSKPQAALSLLQ